MPWLRQGSQIWNNPSTITFPFKLSNDTASPVIEVRVKVGAFSPTLKKLLAETAAARTTHAISVSSVMMVRLMVASFAAAKS